MFYLKLGEELMYGQKYTTPKEIKVRKKHVCSFCTKDINKGEIAVICYTKEISNTPSLGRCGDFEFKLEKQYLHSECIEGFESDLENEIIEE